MIKFFFFFLNPKKIASSSSSHESKEKESGSRMKSKQPKKDKEEIEREQAKEQARLMGLQQEEEKQKLYVSNFKPEGLLPSNQLNTRNQISITFTQQLPIETKFSSFFSITPDIPGSWAFASPDQLTTVVFNPTNPTIQNSTEFSVTVSKSLRAQNQRELDKAPFPNDSYSFTFQSPCIELSQSWYESIEGYQPPNAAVLLKFSQLVNPSDVLKVCSLVWSKPENIKKKTSDQLVLLNENEIKTLRSSDSNFAKLADSERIDWIAFRPTTSAYNIVFNLNIGPNVPSKEGVLTSKQSRQTRNWTTVSNQSVENCFHRQGHTNLTEIEIVFSQMLVSDSEFNALKQQTGGEKIAPAALQSLIKDQIRVYINTGNKITERMKLFVKHYFFFFLSFKKQKKMERLHFL